MCTNVRGCIYGKMWFILIRSYNVRQLWRFGWPSLCCTTTTNNYLRNILVWRQFRCSIIEVHFPLFSSSSFLSLPHSPTLTLALSPFPSLFASSVLSRQIFISFNGLYVFYLPNWIRNSLDICLWQFFLFSSFHPSSTFTFFLPVKKFAPFCTYLHYRHSSLPYPTYFFFGIILLQIVYTFL